MTLDQGPLRPNENSDQKEEKNIFYPPLSPEKLEEFEKKAKEANKGFVDPRDILDADRLIEKYGTPQNTTEKPTERTSKGNNTFLEAINQWIQEIIKLLTGKKALPKKEDKNVEKSEKKEESKEEESIEDASTLDIIPVVNNEVTKAAEDVLRGIKVHGTNVDAGDVFAYTVSREARYFDDIPANGEKSIGIFQFYAGGELPDFLKYLKEKNPDIWANMNENLRNELNNILSQKDINSSNFQLVFTKYKKPLKALFRNVAKEQLEFKLEKLESLVANIKTLGFSESQQKVILSVNGLRFIIDNQNQLGDPAARKALTLSHVILGSNNFDLPAFVRAFETATVNNKRDFGYLTASLIADRRKRNNPFRNATENTTTAT